MTQLTLYTVQYQHCIISHLMVIITHLEHFFRAESDVPLLEPYHSYTNTHLYYIVVILLS